MKEEGGLIAPFDSNHGGKFNNEPVQGEYTLEPESSATNVSFCDANSTARSTQAI